MLKQVDCDEDKIDSSENLGSYSFMLEIVLKRYVATDCLPKGYISKVVGLSSQPLNFRHQRGPCGKFLQIDRQFQTPGYLTPSYISQPSKIKLLVSVFYFFPIPLHPSSSTPFF